MTEFNYVKSMVNEARYVEKADGSQQDYVTASLRELIGESPAVGEIKAGQLLADARAIKDSFSDKEKEVKNRALSKFRMQLKRALETYDEAGDLKIGHKFASGKTPYDRLEITTKKVKDEDTVDTALARLIGVYGEAEVAEAVNRHEALTDALLSMAIKAAA